MRKDLTEIVCCPVHKTHLDLTIDEEDDHGHVLAGHFHCKACDFRYPIEEGIPNLLPPEYHAAAGKGKKKSR